MTLEELFTFYMEFPAFGDVDLCGVNQHGNFNQYPIHLAASRGEVEELEVLVNNGANVNMQGEHGFSPLHMATLRNNVDAVLFLLHNGSDPSIQNDWEQTALHMAQVKRDMCGESQKILSILSEHTSRTH